MASLQKTLDGIQHLRWWAAAIVVLYHLSRLDIPSFADLPYRLAIAGNLGVQIFFVISGFIITIICLDSENKAKLSPGVFATRRLTRIVPIMWIATGSYFLLRYLGTGTFDWAATWRTFLLWPNGSMEFGLLWTLRLELFFYFLFALVFLVDRRLLPILLLWFVAPIAMRLALPSGPPFPDGPDTPIWIYLMGHQVGANIQFGLGLLLGWLFNKRHNIFQYSIGGGSWTVAVGAIAILVLNEYVPVLRSQTLSGILLGSVSCTLLVYMCLLLRPSSGLIDRFSLLLGDASYSIYLFHAPILLIMAYVIKRTGFEAPVWLTAASILAVAVGLPLAIHLILEKPLLSWLKKATEPRPTSAGGRKQAYDR